MDDTKTIKFASTVVDIPASCPQPDIFKRVFMKLLLSRFGSAEQAEIALAQHQAIRAVPAPFAGNSRAEQHYRDACLAVNAKADGWESFTDELFREFLAWEDDGSDKEPAIPGWDPDFHQLG